MARTKAAAPEQQEHTGPYPCPMCATFVDTKTAICPSCGEVLKHSPRFAVVRTGPDFDWRDVGLPYVAILWALVQIGGLFVLNGGNYLGGGVAIASILIAFGVIFRLDWLTGIGKFVCGLAAVRGMFLLIASLTSSPKYLLAATTGGVLIVLSALLGYMIYYNEE